MDAVGRVAAGGSVINPAIVAALLARRRQPDPLGRLTDREREVLALVAEGRSNRAISSRLQLTLRTVESHIRSIHTKLDLAATDDDHPPGPGRLHLPSLLRPSIDIAAHCPAVADAVLAGLATWKCCSNSLAASCTTSDGKQVRGLPRYTPTQGPDINMTSVAVSRGGPKGERH
jgi:DNA-binding CsgD family transcriptional regulator